VLFTEYPFREYSASDDKLRESLIEQSVLARVVSGKEREERAAALAAKLTKYKREKKKKKRENAYLSCTQVKLLTFCVYSASYAYRLPTRKNEGS
jgi:6-phosphogluconate dehydrogenase